MSARNSIANSSNRSLAGSNLIGGWKIGVLKSIAAIVFTTTVATSFGAPIRETEPNNSCATAQNLSSPYLPKAVDGNLTFAAGDQRVDFFKAWLPAGSAVRAWLLSDWFSEDYTLTAPNLGLFLDGCATPVSSVDGSQSSYIRLEFTVPPSGKIILGVAGAGDGQFSGNGGSAGTYRIALFYDPRVGSSISGTVVDSVSRQPICEDGVAGPRVSVTQVGHGIIAAMNAACDDGSFMFGGGRQGEPFRAGTYRVSASKYQYQTTRVGPFELVDGMHLDLGEIAIIPPPLKVENLVPCSDLSTDARKCVFTIDLANNRNQEVRIEPWVNIEAYDLGSWIHYSRFDLQPLGDRVVVLPALGMRTVRFSSPLPTLPAEKKNANLSYTAWAATAGTNRYDTVYEGFLFSLTRNSEGESFIDEE